MKIADLNKPLAIAMWDSSWLRRRYAGGGFEDFGQALDELVERGYNAVRIDAFPHYIANAPDGTNAERFLDVPGVSHQKFGFARWGSPWTVYSYPRRDIVDFIRKAKERGVYVALSTWLKPMWDHRNDLVEGPEELIRVWDETLQFLAENNCLDNVVYVDVHNEIPNGACNTWLYHQMESRKNPFVPGKWNERQKEFFRGYFRTVIRELKARWPQLSFAASFDNVFEAELEETDLSDFDFFDIHIWVQRATCNFLENTGYFEHIGGFGEPSRMYLNTDPAPYTGAQVKIPGDFYFEQVNEAILTSWEKNKAPCFEWMEERIETVAKAGKQYGVPIGCTEGWGSILWAEHPMLSWTVIKEAGLKAAELGAKNGYLFNCQSNFCGPQFTSLWRDIEYHKQVTDVIRKIK